MGRYTLLLSALFALACGKNEACTRARLEASDAWKNVMTQAGAAKLHWPGFDELDESKKAESVKTWTAIETQSELVFKSFAYERITWKTADPARQKVEHDFQNFFAHDDFVLFNAALKGANQKYDAAAKACRD